MRTLAVGHDLRRRGVLLLAQRIGEDTGGLNHDIDAQVFPGQLGGVFFGEALDGLAIDHQVGAGSYGGQLSAWIITVTNVFKAAIPKWPITNLVSYNYMTYYNQYEQMEFGIFPHQGNLMDLLWQRSSLKYVAQVHTPVMLMHGENDADVPIAEAGGSSVAVGRHGDSTQQPPLDHG